jgi:hypothetical protein
MLAISLLLGSALLGTWLTRRVLRDRLDFFEQAMWGTVVGWVLSALLIYALARWQGQLSYSLVLWSTIILSIAGVFLTVTELRGKRISLSSIPEYRCYLGLIILLLVLAPIYWRLLSVQVFPHYEGGIYSGSADNDLAFHAALTSSFAFGKNFPPTYILLPPEPLSYPYLADFHAAVLMTTGLNLRAAFIITALILGVLTAGLFYALALRIAQSQLAATVATLLFFLNGGLGFIYFFRDWWQSGKGLLAFFNTLHVNYAKMPERGIHWTNLIADTLVPQRTSLFGLPLAFMIFTLFAIVWRQRNDENKALDERQSLIALMVAGTLAGVLPLFHTHTYVAVGLVSIGLFALRPRRAWFAFWTPAVLLAAPNLLTLYGRASDSGIVHVLFGWTGHDEKFFPIYLLRNLGLPLLLAIPAWWAAPRQWRKFYLAFLVPLAATFIVVISPSVFDNGKLIYYWHALNSIFIAMWLIKLATVHRQKAIALLLTIPCVLTAVLVFGSETNSTSRMFSDEELAAAVWVREHTPAHALFLAAPTLRQPVLSFAGRAVVNGAAPWVYSHGYEFRAREADVRRIYAGTVDAFDLIRYYNIDYIYFGEPERSDLPANTDFLEHNFAAVYRTPKITIYDARSATARPTNQPDRFRNPAPRELAGRIERDPFALIVAFPRTSFFVYRLFKPSYGTMPRRQEFLTAMSLLGRGLFIGAPDWEKQLETNRAVLLDDWTNSREFKQLYDGIDNAKFIETLLRNAGIEWSVNERSRLAAALDRQTESRQSALLAVVEDKNLYAREYDTAYVLVHFFGYLRRNPDDAPDRDLKGLMFWRDQLNRSGDYRVISRAFIESDEYRKLPPAP